MAADESQEQELPLYRADGALRTVYLEQAGQWTVRFVYSPMSFKLGLYLSFLAGMSLLLLALYWAWGRFYRPENSAGDVRTVAKNSLVPMTLSLLNKAMDFAFAMLYVRILGPEGTGSYAFVVAFYGFFEIVSRYGLGTLLTRDVAADKNNSSRYLTNVLGLRTLLWLGSLPLMALAAFGFWGVGRVSFLDASGIGAQELTAIAIFAVAMLFANWSDGFSSMFLAFEKMEYPAGLASASRPAQGDAGRAGVAAGLGLCGAGGRKPAREHHRHDLALPAHARHALPAAVALGSALAALDAARERAVDDQPPAGDHLLAHRRVDSAPIGGRGGGRPVQRRPQVSGRPQHYPQRLHAGGLPVDEPLCAARARKPAAAPI